MCKAMSNPLDEYEVFRRALKRFQDYLKHLETIPEKKLTARERELLKEYGRGRKTRV